MNHPTDIAVTLQDLIALEHLTFQSRIIPKRRVFSILAGRNISKLRGRGLDFEEVRKYSPGEDIRNIDWKVTARTKVPHTKVFTEEKERPVFTIVDQTSYMFFGSVRFTKSVIAAQAAAIGGFRTLKIGDRFGGIIFNENSYQHVKPKRSRATLLQFLDHVSSYNLSLTKRKKLNSNRQALNASLERARLSIGHDYIITLITDLKDANEETIDHLLHLSMHNDVIVVNISDPYDQQIPDFRQVITDGEFQILLKGKEENRKQNIEQYLNGSPINFKEIFNRYSIALMELDTLSTVGEQLKIIFGKVQ